MSKYGFLAATTMLFFSFTYRHAFIEFSASDLVLIGILSLAVLIAEAGVAWVLSRVLDIRVILALFAVANIYVVHLVFVEAFVNLAPAFRIAVLATGCFVAFTALSVIGAHKRTGTILVLSIVAVSLAVATVPILSGSADRVERERSSDGMTSAANVPLIDFQDRPNVYLISFDSLIPRAIAQTYMNIAGTAYHHVMETRFRRIPNLFSDATPTRRSLNSLLAFDPQHFASAYSSGTGLDFFSGLEPSPLFELFNHNGYETNTLYRSRFFGELGPYVDRYTFPASFSVCQLMVKKGDVLPFFGYCALRRIRAIESLLKSVGITSRSLVSDGQFLMDALHDAVRRDAPQIMLAYVYSPGHTGQEFDASSPADMAAYVESFSRESEKTADLLHDLADFIDKEDPDAILYVFGDHGAYLSRRTELQDDPVFYVQDRFGIEGGLYPVDRCAEAFDAPYFQEFSTNLLVAHTIVRCLSEDMGGITMFDPSAIQLPLLGQNVPVRFEDYVYE